MELEDLKNFSFEFFDLLSEKDFFSLVDKNIKIPREYYKLNKSFIKNNNILEWVIKNDPMSVLEFLEDAFTEENINTMLNNSLFMEDEFVIKFPFLLDNLNYRLMFVKTNPSALNYLKSNQMTIDIIHLLEEMNYVLKRKDMEKFPLLLNNTNLFKTFVESNHNWQLEIPYMNNEIVFLMLHIGYIPKKEDFDAWPQLCNYRELLLRAFKADVSAIVYFKSDLLSCEETELALKRGYIATETDLKKNPELGSYFDIMGEAIKRDPHLIVYLQPDCFFTDIIKNALTKYEITVEDLYNHPQLRSHRKLMACLPQYKNYSTFLSEEEKVKEIQKCLLSGSVDDLLNLPFLLPKFGSKTEISDVMSLVHYLYEQIDETNEDVQETWFNFFDQIINNIINIRYENNKYTFAYSDIVAVHNDIIRVFSNLSYHDVENQLSQFTIRLCKFSEDGKKSLYNDIRAMIDQLYNLYLEKGNLDLADTSIFTNKLLNWHRNAFIRFEKNKIKESLSSKLDLMLKKKKSLYIGRKMEIIANMLEQGKYDKLGISISEIKEIFKIIRQEIINNKKLRKSKIIISDKQFDKIEKHFIKHGIISHNALCNILGMEDIRAFNFIRNKYNKIYMSCLDSVTLEKKEQRITDHDKSNFGYNYNNFIIRNNTFVARNLALLILKLDNQTLKNILDLGSNLYDLKDIIPFIDLLEEFDMNTFINIITNYSKIKKTIISYSPYLNNHINLFGTSFDEIVKLANGYNMVNDTHLTIFGEYVCKQLGEADCYKYLDFYLEMLKRKKGLIPPVSYLDDSFIVQSGNYSSVERLLIGKWYQTSCIDLLNSAGAPTYGECLVGLNGDVIVVKNRFDNSFCTRILAFRRGNVVQLAMKKNDTFELPLTMLLKFARQIIEQASVINDNIDFVFINGQFSKLDKSVFPIIKDDNFVCSFPHADLDSYATLIGIKDNCENIMEKMNFDALPKGMYDKIRQGINLTPTTVDINRIKALNTYLLHVDLKKDSILNEFSPFYHKDYQDVVCGEDWYIAIKNNGETEELILPIADEKTFEEIEMVKNRLNNNSLKCKK